MRARLSLAFLPVLLFFSMFVWFVGFCLAHTAAMSKP